MFIHYDLSEEKLKILQPVNFYISEMLIFVLVYVARMHEN
jgi:hypothetical protein